MKRQRKSKELAAPSIGAYKGLVTDISELLEQARRTAARSVNSLLTGTYWEVGRRIVEFEQGGKARADYGEELLKRLGKDLSGLHGRGFSHQGLYKMRALYLGWQIFPTVSGKLEARTRLSDEIFPTLSGIPAGTEFAQTPFALFDARANRPTLSSDSTARPILPTVSAESLEHGKLQTVSAKSGKAFDIR